MFFASIAILVLILSSLFAFLWAMLQGGTIPNDTSFWFMFAFISGLMTIFLPCTLPLAFVTVPLAREKFMLRSLGMILLFALGVFVVLGLYGGVLGAFGSYWMGLFPGEALLSIVAWVYFLGGLYAYALSLGELGLLPLRMPTYTGRSPDFITKKRGPGRMFFLGLFLGNVGVGCPFPAVPLLLISAVLSGSASYGVVLFLIHAIGRILPLLVLLSLATVNVDGLSWLVRHKARFDRASGWVFIVFTAFLVTVGTYSHQWLYSTEIYKTVGFSLGKVMASLPTSLSYEAGVFGGVVPGASTAFLLLLIIPLWWGYFKTKSQTIGTPLQKIKKLEHEIEHLLTEVRGHEAALHIPEGKQHERVRDLDRHIDTLLSKRQIIEEGARYGAQNLESKETEAALLDALHLRRNWYVTLTVLLIIVVYAVLS
jgi:cytochrome c-type biogenesis protein